MNENLNSKREYHQTRLKAYILNHYNLFDSAVDQVIIELKEKIEKEYDDHNYWMELEKYDLDKFNEIDELANTTGHSLNIQMREYIETALNLEDELVTLYEMKIIYAFKHLEISLKNFISFAFQDKTISKNYKWHNIIEYLRNKKIDLQSISGYTEVNQLREVNNSLKHSSENYDKSINHISEFSNKNNKRLQALELFYDRIEPNISLFLTSLLKITIDELYKYDDQKLKSIADSITLKMDKENATKLLKLIENNY